MTEYKWVVPDLAGEHYMQTHSASERRDSGSTYTPPDIVEMMIDDALGKIDPACVVDCGGGSGRFAIAAARAFPSAKVYAVDNSHEACAMCRENVKSHGLESRIEVVESDFLDFSLPDDRGKTLWIGNPPYVRHHKINKVRKAQFKDKAKAMGLPASALAGLHVHFIAHIAELWHEGDFAELITSAEWLDVGYGSFVRHMLVERLSLVHLKLFDRGFQIFDGIEATAVIFSFSSYTSDSVCVETGEGRSAVIKRETLANSEKWTVALEGRERDASALPLVPLGSFVAVHRGVVTGNNKFWVRKPEDLDGIPSELTIPIVSRANEITGECVAQNNPEKLKRLIALPCNIEELPKSARCAAERILDDGSARKVDEGYVARSRKAWWSVKPPEAPAVMMTYMSRKAPTFIKNKRHLPMLNTIHGLYPKVELSNRALSNLVDYLNNNVELQSGRTYCGGLVKFEPREVEAILVPSIEQLERMGRWSA